MEQDQQFNEKQRHILELAENLFASKGFDGTSVRDIANEAGVNIAMISYYFGSKEKLLQAVFKMRADSMWSELERMLHNQQLSPLEKVFRLIDNFVDRMMNDQHFHKLMIREQIAEKSVVIGRMIIAIKKRNQDLIKTLIAEGQKKGAFKKNIDTSLMVITMIGTVNQLISTQHIYRQLNNLENLSDLDFQKYIRKRLKVHLKSLFKDILTNEN